MSLIYLNSTISTIGVENFRTFKNEISFLIAPLTLLVGPNGSGKSVLQKILMLLSSGLKSLDGDWYNLDSIYFGGKNQKLTGDYFDNLCFNGNNNSFCLSFNFEDVLFEQVKVKIRFKPQENGLYAVSNRIDFTRNRNLILAFNKVGKKNNTTWVIQPENHIQFAALLRSQLIQYKNSLIDDNDLLLIDEKLRENKNLTKNEILLKEKAESERGLFLNQIEPDYENNFSGIVHSSGLIFSEKEDDLSLPESFFIRDKELLINTPLVNLILGEKDILNKQTKKYEKIKKELNKYSINTKRDFIKAYEEFELDIFLLAIKKMPISNNSDKSKEIYSSSNFQDCFGIENHHYNLWLTLENFKWKSDIYKVLKKFSLYNFGSIDEANSNQTKKHENFFHDIVTFIVNQYTRLPRFFSQQLFLLLKSFHLSLQNSVIKSNYMLEDEGVVDSPFLEYAKQYFSSIQNFEHRKEFVNTWLKKFNIADKLNPKIIKNGSKCLGYAFLLEKGGKEYELNSFGLGINRLVQLILKVTSGGYYGYKNYLKKQLIMLEEPEVNLHPRFQSILADFFVAASKSFNIYFIIETHSEYLIRRFQYLVANPESEVSNDDISLYYLYHPEKVPEGHKQVEKLEINNDGSLDGEFGKGFFDEASNWKMELMRLKHAQKN